MSTRISSKVLAGFFILLNVAFVRADVITLHSGTKIQGTVIQRDDEQVLILADYGTTMVPASIVTEIVPEPDRRPVTLSTNTVSIDSRIPNWTNIVSKLASQGWAYKLRQIPATVVTNGVMRNVPYISFRCGIDYEVNIYGELDNPAGVEIGFYRSLLTKKDYASGKAMDFISTILQRPDDRDALRALNLKKDSRVLNGLTLEITPETDADSHGGWWISVYNVSALEQARVSDSDLANISELNSAIIKADTTAESTGGWTTQDLKYARPSTVVAQPFLQTPATTPSWSPPNAAPEHSAGSVYVQGYYRKNGTYVSPYTRRR